MKKVKSKLSAINCNCAIGFIQKKVILSLCMFFVPLIMMASHDLQNLKVTINMENASLKEVLKEIERQTHYSFYYNEKQVDSKRIVSVNAKDKEVSDVLDEIIADYSYKTEKNMIIVTPKSTSQRLSATSSTLGAQQQMIEIKGVVLDEAGEALTGASISYVGAAIGTSADENGAFTMSVPSLNGKLKVSYLGYKETIIDMNGRKEFNIVLQEDTETLDEVVVVGYGTQRKKDLTGGISSLNTEKLEKIPTNNIAKRLQGQIAGMSVTSTAEPGSSATVLIRGERSLSGGSAPLVILDGIPFSAGLAVIDQSSIENISVLKDASAAAIYGARATNGVILVTTKKGQEGKPVVRYNGYVSVQTPERLFDIQNGAESMAFLGQYYRDLGYAESYWQNPESFLSKTTLPLANYQAGKEFNWQDEMFKPAFSQEHQLSLSGATQSSNYYASVTYNDQNGMVKNTPYQKISATINMSQKIGKWLTVGTNNQYSQNDNNGVTPDFAMAFRLTPYSNPYNEDGTMNRYPMYTETYWYNPYVNQDGVYDNRTRSLFSAWYADILLPVKGLTFRTNFGYNFKTNRIGTYYGSSTLSGEGVNGIATVSGYDYDDWTWENIMKYDQKFGKHQLNLTGMISAQKTQNKSFSMEAKDFLNDDNAYHNMDAAQGEQKTNTDKTETQMASYMFRANYNYDSRYLLTLTARYDGYSAFGKNNKWAFFPSAALGWVASEEGFFQDWGINEIDFLKFRLSYGANGNAGMPPYNTLTKMTQKDYIYGDGGTHSAGLYNGYERGNPSLRWESTYALNGGLDFGLLRNRITGNLEAYIANTEDLLMSRTVVIMNGYNKMNDNIGHTRTKGIELTLNTVNMKNKNFEWMTSFIGSGNWSKITKLREDGKDDIASSWFIGQPIRVFYDYKVVGIWQLGEETEAAKFGAKPGDARLWDKNGNEKLDADDRTIIGSRLPVWTAGMTNTFSYKNWTFSFFLNGVFDITKQNGTLEFNGRQLAKNTNFINGINYWTPENPSTEATRLGYMPKNSHKFYSDASFVRLQDVNLSYNFPKAFTDKLSIQKLTMYLNGSNLYTFSGVNKYGINPEQDVIGNTATYPVARTFVLGLNITF